ncbi:glutamine-hydrolyzing carbamoyl-phosphate synthase small subunit [Lichenibacterium dinghuense]|uniref:glutamine-hydrolyzing carbamoyl-phosphate synthase small subunit n=1 Tax=Lichenibacterium dinghuense TaxID=2895977 RepID=UPI001F032D61|nr:glutamine-hydrolyzing carbamoyl-phosphate synthase small subunit [Lichenibacterium sp. 6Y81]
MSDGQDALTGWADPVPTALLVLADGTVLEGSGFGATGAAEAEVCFNTAMTGYEEILTDPSYSGQIVTFTFPHIGNVGVNDQDEETLGATENGVRGVVLHAAITAPSNHRAKAALGDWLAARGIIGIGGIDTRALTAVIRESGMPNAVIAHDPQGRFDREALKARAAAFRGMQGTDLVPDVTSAERSDWDETVWSLASGFGRQDAPKHRVVAIDYGIKRNILRLLADAGCAVTVVPASASAEDIMALEPDGVFLSNGPGDPAETARYAGTVIREIVDRRVPTFGICLGHQLLALSLGAKTVKMHQGHHGANHPVKDQETGRVEIVSMNHGFAVDPGTLPPEAVETHVSLFDGTNCGISLSDRPAFSVQYHPEASPGPHDSHGLFRRFVGMIEADKASGKLRGAR